MKNALKICHYVPNEQTKGGDRSLYIQKQNRKRAVSLNLTLSTTQRFRSVNTN